MSKKQVVLVASRAIALYLILWSLGNLGSVPALVFSVTHEPAQSFVYRYHLVLLSSQVVLSIGLFLAAVWTYRCGPKIEAFLSPSED